MKRAGGDKCSQESCCCLSSHSQEGATDNCKHVDFVLWAVGGGKVMSQQGPWLPGYLVD